jgi:flagellar hook-associated protein 3 FlgL
MSFLSIGDLAQSFQTLRRSAQLKTELARRNDELTSGRTADPARRLGGDYGALADIERGLTRLAAFASATRETALHATALQERLSRLTDDGATISGQLVAVGGGAAAGLVNSVAAAARGVFDAAVSMLNSGVADRALFAGRATGGAAVLDGPALLAELAADTAGATTAAELQDAVTAWFDTPGGFETKGWLGSGTDLGPIAIGPEDVVTLPASAASPEIRRHLAGLALAALVDGGALAGDDAARAEALRSAGRQLAEARPGLVGLSAHLGAVEARIDLVAARNAAEATGLEFARQDLLAADPYEAAIRLEEARARLDTMFAVTARLSRLSLTEHLR